MYRVVLSPESHAHLLELREYITHRSSRAVANRYLRGLEKFYRSLSIAPHRGEERFAHRPGLRSIGFEHRITILFAVFDDEKVVEIIGFYYSGRTP